MAITLFSEARALKVIQANQWRRATPAARRPS